MKQPLITAVTPTTASPDPKLEATRLLVKRIGLDRVAQRAGVSFQTVQRFVGGTHKTWPVMVRAITAEAELMASEFLADVPAHLIMRRVRQLAKAQAQAGPATVVVSPVAIAPRPQPIPA